MTQSCSKQIMWMGIQLKVPEDWEVVRHSLSPSQGSLYLVDRHRQRLQLNWRRTEQTPDVRRSCEEYQAKMKEEGSADAIEELDEISGWQGLRQRETEKEVIRAVKYDKSAGQLLEFIIVHFGGDRTENAALTKNLLKKCQAVRSPEESRNWIIFGINAMLPEGWLPVRSEVKPMKAKLNFKCSNNRRDRRSITLQRLGMADTWYNGDPQNIIDQDEEDVKYTWEKISYGTHSADLGEADIHTLPIDRFLRRNCQRKELIWHCPHSNAVFRISTVSTCKQQITPDDVSIKCH